jgi:hypothetical protein
MRLYKKKDISKSHHSTLDCPPGLPSGSPGSTTPDRLRLSASRYPDTRPWLLSSKMKLPRPPMFSTKSDHPYSLPPTQSKAVKRSGKPQTVPGRFFNPKAPTSAVSLKQRPVLSNVDTNLPPLTRPSGLGSEKTTSPINKPSAPRTAPKMPRSVQSPIHPSLHCRRLGPSPRLLLPTIALRPVLIWLASPSPQRRHRSMSTNPSSSCHASIHPRRRTQR